MEKCCIITVENPIYPQSRKGGIAYETKETTKQSAERTA